METVKYIIDLFKDRAKEINEGEINYNFKTDKERYYAIIYVKNSKINKINIVEHTKTERINIDYRVKPTIIIPYGDDPPYSPLTNSPTPTKFINVDL